MTALRMMFFTASTVIGLGIYLSGWNQVHWLLYLPPIGFLISGLTGFCPPIFLIEGLERKMKKLKQLSIFIITLGYLLLPVNTNAKVICIGSQQIDYPKKKQVQDGFNFISQAYASADFSLKAKYSKIDDKNKIKSVVSFLNAIAEIQDVDMDNITNKIEIEKLHKSAFYFEESNKYILALNVKEDRLAELERYNSYFIESINKKRVVPSSKKMRKATKLVISLLTGGVYRAEIHSKIGTPNHFKGNLKF